MANIEKLPKKPGVYRFETISGTVHIISTIGRPSWERRPAPGAGVGHYDFRPMTLSELGPGWEVGGKGYLVVADETYLTGATWHLTAQIVTISEEPNP